ncbi:MarR family transcriptional regulator [Leptospira gomenensis]|uniref:MarR family transcriptional regulator n=1 Tax=Leptospira gomenensis TaxID=2484974 RepID=A0A5F1Y7Y1_9LEPT|nr:MarR family transcriptional regulator [Leptospira gomenensis]TGK28945.1 MarR family transcriptional regulator [Leptospira gomenensis]TGK35406.1 MarR family transcriptional regulator [Leptospira gomenensis]TGK40704.1 MarR family transcriptional regulator [Leptospira gomenensis]TGK68452.1 MarR family transcriptional regulator [Leptospira gomenensis]
MKQEFAIHLLSRTRDRIQKFLLREFEKEGIKDLVPAHGGVLYALGVSGETTMGELAKILDRSNSTVTALLDKMEELKYVKRNRSEQDERVYTASLTAKGKSTRESVIRASQTTNQKLYKGFTAEEKETFMRFLERIHSNFER